MTDTPQPLITHLTELRQRLIYCVGVFIVLCGINYYFSEQIFSFLAKPLGEIAQGRRLIYTSLTEAFTTYVKVSLFGAFFLTFPFIAIQVWKFVAPALYQKEKRFFKWLLIATPLLFLMGALFAYYVIFPTAYTFFLSFESMNGAMPIQLEAKVDEYLNFVMRLILAFGICFEMPVILALLALSNIVTYKMLKQHWRIAVVIIFAVAAVITPPDLMSMLGLAIPLVLLYALTLLMVKFIR